MCGKSNDDSNEEYGYDLDSPVIGAALRFSGNSISDNNELEYEANTVFQQMELDFE